MTRQELLQRSSTLLGRFAHEVKVANAMGQFDINSIAEDFLVPILSNALGCPNLLNQNRIQMNFPAVDLGCNSSRISIQITSDPSSGKVIETLKKFDAHDLKSDFDKLFFYMITERQNVYSSQKLKQIVDKASIPFDPTSDIFDYRDLAKMLETLSTDKLQLINDHLESEFKKADNDLQFRSNLEEFTGVSRQKIEDEKRTKKYIPSVFVETTTTKEEMRYFANPMFFFRKIDDDLRRISLDRFNGILEMAKIEPIAKNIQDVQNLAKPTDLTELQGRFERQHRALEAIQELVSPYSWYGEKAERYEPADYLNGYWEVFRHSIQSSGSGIFTALERISEKINIARAKIFLVTGMAGQGKTNFVCDLVENQFRAFEVPTIFIPARSLNDYSSSSRILSYIKNNRFAPDVSNLHDLLALLNNVAAECQKPFILVIDGINEIGDLDGFVAELRVLLEALCQYDFLKVVVTCRSEFFDHKFAEVFEPQFSDHLYRVQDLRKKMSDGNKVRLLSAYLEHFKIDARLSKTSSTFLENDLILLRIFCEINENKNIGRVPDIYKGDIFEDYLLMKIKEFPVSARQNVLTSLYKICSKMLSDENFTQLSLEGFDLPERQIVDRLIGEDIILRREVPTSGLSSVGVENISFTYDELRDFLLAYYTVMEMAASNSDQLTEIFIKLPQWPIYEGFFRYVYILARKQKNTQVLAACEESRDFEKHYLNNLTLLSADIQTPEDVERLKLFLQEATTDHKIRQVTWFLFRKRELSEQLNVQILLDHMNGLDDEGSERLVRSMFSRSSDYRVNTWQDRVSGLIKNFLEIDDEHRRGVGVPATALVLHFAPHAHWDEREDLFNHFGEPKNALAFRAVSEVCRRAVSQRVINCLEEISEPREGA